jgi:hypothetical protein
VLSDRFEYPVRDSFFFFSSAPSYHIRLFSHRKSILSRSWCYPFIAPSPSSSSLSSSSFLHDRHRKEVSLTSDFISVDKDIRYVIDMEAPLVMKTDNPNMKVIFVIRHPVERLIAHFQELSTYYPTLVRRTCTDRDMTS